MNTSAVPNVDAGLSYTLMNTAAVPTVEAEPPYTENYTLMNKSAVTRVDARPSCTLMRSSAVTNIEAGPSYTENQSLTNTSAVPYVEAGLSHTENHSLRNTSAVPSVEAGRYYPDNHSMISIDCSSPYAEGNEISLSPVRQSQEWANVGMIEESTIFKRRLHRTPRRRGGEYNLYWSCTLFSFIGLLSKFVPIKLTPIPIKAPGMFKYVLYCFWIPMAATTVLRLLQYTFADYRHLLDSLWWRYRRMSVFTLVCGYLKYFSLTKKVSPFVNYPLQFICVVQKYKITKFHWHVSEYLRKNTV